MSISQRNDGRYIVKYKDGSKWKQKTFRAREDAEGFERSIQYDEPENTRLTVTESILLFLKNTRHCRKGVQYYALILSRMPEVLATRYVDSLDRRDLMTFRSTLQDEYKLSPCSINCHTSKLIAAWRWCASEDFLQFVPWEKYRPLPEGPHGHNCGDFADFMKIYDACNPALQWFIRTCLALCLRPGKEAAGLCWRDVDLIHGRVHVWMPKVSRHKDVIAPAWWTEEARQKAVEKAPEGYVCPNLHGGPFCWSTALWEKTARRTLGRSFPLYTVRHMAASLMLEAGADPAAVAAQLGHASVATTAEFYTHAVKGAQERAAGKIPDLSLLMVQDGAEISRNMLEYQEN